MNHLESMNVKWMLWIVDVLAILVILGPKNRYRKVGANGRSGCFTGSDSDSAAKFIHAVDWQGTHWFFLIYFCSFKHCMVCDSSQNWLDYCKIPTMIPMRWCDAKTATQERIRTCESFACQLEFTVSWFISFPSTRLEAEGSQNSSAEKGVMNLMLLHVVGMTETHWELMRKKQ